MNKLESLVENLKRYVLLLLLITLAALLVYVSVEYTVVVFRAIYRHFVNSFLSGLEFQRGTLVLFIVQELMAGALLIIVFIELFESVYFYLKHKHQEYTRIVLEIVLISVLRHVIVLDIEHTEGWKLGGLALLVLVISSFYIAYRYFNPSKSEV